MFPVGLPVGKVTQNELDSFGRACFLYEIERDSMIVNTHAVYSSVLAAALMSCHHLLDLSISENVSGTQELRLRPYTAALSYGLAIMSSVNSVDEDLNWKIFGHIPKMSNIVGASFISL